MSRIFIYTGLVQSGKTTRLASWVKTKKSKGGLLAHTVKGEKHLESLHSGEIKNLGISPHDPDGISVGRYWFSSKVLSWARKQLFLAVDSKVDLLIVDEIGPLELEGKGYEPAFREIIASKLARDMTLIIVVRNHLVDRVITHFDLNRAIIIDDLNRIEERK